MTAENRCPNCGAERPENAPEGLCPRCLMGQALADDQFVPAGDATEGEPHSAVRFPPAALAQGDPEATRMQTARTVVGAAGATGDWTPDRIQQTQTADVNGAARDLPRGASVRYFGDYEVLKELGRGGMGVVYKARQVSLNRPVALKMIKVGILADDAELRRFQNEAEAVALLDHAGIVPVYEVGEHEGQRYFSMKLVEGGNLAEQLASFKDKSKAAAALMAEAALAVHHAHMRGILHRDLKPANILIDSEGLPHVTDFGLAKRIEADLEMTASGAVLGTPAYMSPEQANGRRGTITTATDVYGLGAILYALLTGKAPFGGDSVAETLDAVRSRPPERPARLNAKVPRDLETIALKCLEKEARKRYDSAAALAEDLHRFLDGRPVVSRRVSNSERVYRWCKRNPVVAGLLGTVAALVLVGFVGAITAAIYFGQAAASERLARLDADNARKVADARRREAEASRAEAISQKQKAEASYALARKAVDDSYTKISESALLNVPGLRPLRRALMESARPFYEDFLRDRADDPALLTDLAATQFRIGQILSDLSEQDKARLALRRAVELYDKALAARPGEVAVLEGQAEVWHRLGDLDYRTDRPTANAAYRKAISIRERLAAEHPAQSRFRMALSRSLNGLAISSTVAAEIRDAYRRSLELRLKLADEIPEDPDLLHGLCESFLNVGIVIWNDGHREECVALLKPAIDYGRAAVARRPHDLEFASDLSAAYSSGASYFWQLGRGDEALALSGESVAFVRKLSADNPDVRSYRDALANAMGDYGQYLQELGRTDEAVSYRRQASEVLETKPDPDAGALATAAFYRARLAWLLAGESAERGITSWPEASRREADQAIADLRASVALGFRRAEIIRADVHFKALMTRDDLRALLVEMERPAANPQPAPAPARARSPLDQPGRLDHDRFLGQATIGLLQGDNATADEVRARLEAALARIEARLKSVPRSPALEAAARSIRMKFSAGLDAAFPSDPFAR
jgi:tRNA A-37 threonylcarbamoyl transferase component Bud32/tetratricopeptide (TPR) repeat protein